MYLYYASVNNILKCGQSFRFGVIADAAAVELGLLSDGMKSLR